MASYKGVQGALTALEEFFKGRLPTDLSSGPTNAQVKLLGSQDIASKLSGNLPGVYFHRLTIDDHGRARYFTNQGTNPVAVATQRSPLCFGVRQGKIMKMNCIYERRER